MIVALSKKLCENCGAYGTLQSLFLPRHQCLNLVLCECTATHIEIVPPYPTVEDVRNGCWHQSGNVRPGPHIKQMPGGGQSDAG